MLLMMFGFCPTPSLPRRYWAQIDGLVLDDDEALILSAYMVMYADD